jgi:hypothetical protein
VIEGPCPVLAMAVASRLRALLLNEAPCRVQARWCGEWPSVYVYTVGMGERWWQQAVTAELLAGAVSLDAVAHELIRRWEGA